MIKGVNLGNWLVLEKWMSPQLFAGTDAEDESHLCTSLDPAAKAQLYQHHRDTYITERDFIYLASKGIDAVRIPVPFFIFGDYEPYVGCIEYLDRAFTWADEHGVRVFVELHTVPGSQNGFDNGGICGVCRWHKSPTDVAFALGVLEQLTARYRGHPAFWAIGVLNEPVSEQLWTDLDVPHRYPGVDPLDALESEPVPTDFLKSFYRDAYARIRAESEDVIVVFHDGFRLQEWGTYFHDEGFERYVVDTHQYLMLQTWLHGDQPLTGYVDHIVEEWVPALREAARSFPLMVGEWCLNTSSTSVPAGGEERTSYYRTIADAQIEAWQGAMAWFFWSYKLLANGPEIDGWDLGRATDLGFLPSSSRQ